MAMELLHSPILSSSSITIFQFLFSLLLLLLSPLPTSQLQYFINCGSRENATISDGRTFIGDVVNSRQFRISGHRSETLENINHSADPLYQTARIFRFRSTYHFEIPKTGTYILRFHFYPFSSFPELANSQFNVSASGHFLLINFTVAKNASIFPILKEFFIRINQTQNPNLKIHFWPQTLAFVNAIEVISTSQNITEDSGPVVTPEGNRGVYDGQKFKILEKIYRINVGARERDPKGDELWRIWNLDEPFLITKENAQNALGHYMSVERHPGLATMDDAPDIVYQTAKVLKDKVISNLTWRFNLSKGANRYFVRLHFCDIISDGVNPYNFKIYFNTKFGEVINPYNLAWPFYKDYILELDDGIGFVDVSIGPNEKSLNKTFMFLNGLEILQIKDGNAPDPSDDGGGGHLALIVGLVVGGVGIMVILTCVVVLFVHHKRKRKTTELFEWGMVPLNNVGASSHNRSSSSISNLHLGLKIPFVEIQQVTNNFDSNLIIGEGGFGKVYKGTLKNGVKVAVKRSNSNHGQGLSEFQTEIMVLSKIRHYHLVSLIGYCYEEGEMILVYEFMEKGSLRDHLYGSRGGLERETSGSSNPPIGLCWKQRLEICIGAAKGLHYLHTGLDNGIIHRDVKSTNILLDQNFVAKVADFGLSRSQHLEQTHVSTEVKGTFGYLDPEYFRWLQLTEKSDVYSFGVLLLEVLCSRQVIDPSLPRDQINLTEWAKTCQNEGRLVSIIDPKIAGEITPNSLKKFVETAEKCLKEFATERHPMADVLWDLEYALQLQKMATRGGNMQEDSMTNSDASSSLPFPVVRRFPSQSFVDDRDDSVLLDTMNGDIFPQLSFERDGGR